jgi:NifU-like protein involved in Fe-S cluster formation
MLNDLYTKDVLRAAAMISRVGRLQSPQASASRVSPICGSKITVDLNMADGVMTDYAQDIHACALGQAAASIVASHIIGKTPEDLAFAANQMRAMLTEGGEPPTGEWSGLGLLENVKNHKARHGAVLLALEAALDAASQIAGQNYETPSEQLTRKA